MIETKRKNGESAIAGYDLRLDIPARAFIGSQLISLLEKGGSFWDAKKHLFDGEQYRAAFAGMHVYTYQIHDHSLAISLLYCLIVVPREILDLPKDHQIYRDFDHEKAFGGFTIQEPTSIDAFGFVRALRNSVAHALFAVQDHSGKLRYEFWNEHKPLFRATIDHDELIKFLGVVGARLANAVLARR